MRFLIGNAYINISTN